MLGAFVLEVVRTTCHEVSHGCCIDSALVPGIWWQLPVDLMICYWIKYVSVSLHTLYMYKGKKGDHYLGALITGLRV